MSMTENEKILYEKQMYHWFEEHRYIREQLQRTIEYHEKLKESNQKQLELHNARLNLVIEEYNEWAKMHGMKTYQEMFNE